MESKTSSGQILVECAVAMFCLAILFATLMKFHAPDINKKKRFKTKQHELQKKQKLDFTEYRNKGFP